MYVIISFFTEISDEMGVLLFLKDYKVVSVFKMPVDPRRDTVL